MSYLKPLRLWRRRVTVLLLLSLCHGGPAAADGEKAADDPLTREKQTVARILAAVEAEDPSALEAVATDPDIEPWSIVDRLCSQGAIEAARAFAELRPDDGSRLADYADAWHGKADDPEADEALAAESRGAWDEVLRLTATRDTDRSPVLTARLLNARGAALRAQGRPQESVAAHDAAAEVALSISWYLGAHGYLAAGAGVAKSGGNYPLAAELSVRRLSAARHLGSARVIVQALLDLGDVRRLMRVWDASEAVYAEALALARAEGLRDLEMFTIVGLSNVRYSQGAAEETRRLQEQALALAEDLGHERGRMVLLGNLGNTYLSMGLCERAAQYQARALELYRAAGDDYGVTLTLINLGLAEAARGKFVEALAALEEGLETGASIGHVPLCAAALEEISAARKALGNRKDALAAQERALALRERMRDGPGVVRTLGDLGSLLYDLERYDEARERQERGIALAIELGFLDARFTLTGNLANTYQALGDYAEAARLSQEALAHYRAAKEPLNIARILLNLGTAHTEQGRFSEALAVQEEAVEILEPHGDGPMLAQLLMNLGNTHAHLGEADRAEACQERALATFAALEDPLGQVRALINIGNRRYDREDYEEALAAQERALTIAERIGQREMQAVLLGNMANAHRELGNEETSQDLAGRALAIFRELGDRERIAWGLRMLGDDLRKQGKYEQALAAFEEAAAASEALGLLPSRTYVMWSMAATHLDAGDAAAAARTARQVSGMLFDLFGGLADEQGASARAVFQDVLDVGVRAGVALGDTAEVAYFVEAGRAGSLLEALESREASDATAVPDALRAAETEARAAVLAAEEAYAAARTAGNLREVRARRGEVQGARGDLAKILERIQRRAKRTAGVFRPEVADLEKIQARLSADEALVLYAVLPSNSHALVVRRVGARIVPLGETENLEAALSEFSPEDRDASVEEDLQRLRTLLVDPLEVPDDVVRLLVSPDGGLGYVPFALLAPGREIVYVPSGTTYDVLHQDAAAMGKGVLAVGDPAYGDRLPPLSASRAEALAVGDSHLIGKAATESGFREQIASRARWRALHLACHGLVDSERPGFSSLALTRTETDDGLLSAYEVFGMELPADLVVLSACDTGRGRVLRSEGIIGLTRAFMVAGCPRVICSLWKVDDESTRALMEKFYELWNPDQGDGLGAAAALKKAQEYVRSHEKWRHPYYWAAWVLWGLPD